MKIRRAAEHDLKRGNTEFWTLDYDGEHKGFGISKDIYWC